MCKKTIDLKEDKDPLALDAHVVESRYFFFHTSPNPNTELAIIFGGHEKCAPDFEIRRKTYPYFVIEIPLSGSCFFSVEDRNYELKRGTIGVLMPGMEHHYKSDPDNPMEHIFIIFDGTKAKELFHITGLDKKNVMTLAKPGEMLYLAETILQKGLQKKEWTQNLCVQYLHALLLEQTNDLPNNEGAATLSKRTYQNCRKYIDENFSILIGPGDAATACDINSRYLARIFRKFAKITPSEYIMRLKLNKAASLLLMTELSIGEIAREVGFSDPYHFSRNFKKFHGKSPRYYRDGLVIDDKDTLKKGSRE